MNANDMAKKAKSKAKNKVRDTLIKRDYKKRAKLILDPGDGVSRVDLQDINDLDNDNYHLSLIHI